MPKLVQFDRLESGAKQKFHAFWTLTRPLKRCLRTPISEETNSPGTARRSSFGRRWKGAMFGSVVLGFIFSAGMGLSGLAGPTAHGSFGSLPADPKFVKITTCREGDETHFFV